MKRERRSKHADDAAPLTPSELAQALAAVPKARAAWEALTPIARRDYTRWIESAKREDTRQRRVAIACENLAAGKRRPCCYAVVPMDFYKALGAAPVARGKGAKARWSDLSPTEKRDFVDWIDAVPEREERTSRIERVCAILAAGERKPPVA